MTEKQFKKGDVIFREGETGDTLYQIIDGSVEIYAGYQESYQQLLVELGKDAFFGEMAVIEAYPRSATAVAKDDVKVAEIESGQINTYFKSNPDGIIDLMKSMGGRLRDLTTDFGDVSDTIKELGVSEGGQKNPGLIDRIRKFADVYRKNKAAEAFSQEALRKLSQNSHAEGYKTNVEQYKKGTIIFKEGEIGQCMYDIHTGSIGIFKSYGAPDEKLLTKLAPDQFFGELGMIENVKRSGTAVVMEDDTTLEIISPADLKKLFKENPPKVEMILEHISYRLRRLTRDYMSACKMLSRVSDAEDNGGLDENLKKEVNDYIAKFC